MADITLNRMLPAKPPITSVTLELSVLEAKALLMFIGASSQRLRVELMEEASVTDKPNLESASSALHLLYEKLGGYKGEIAIAQH